MRRRKQHVTPLNYHGNELTSAGNSDHIRKWRGRGWEGDECLTYAEIWSHLWWHLLHDNTQCYFFFISQPISKEYEIFHKDRPFSLTANVAVVFLVYQSVYFHKFNTCFDLYQEFSPLHIILDLVCMYRFLERSPNVCDVGRFVERLENVSVRLY